MNDRKSPLTPFKKHTLPSQTRQNIINQLKRNNENWNYDNKFTSKILLEMYKSGYEMDYEDSVQKVLSFKKVKKVKKDNQSKFEPKVLRSASKKNVCI